MSIFQAAILGLVQGLTEFLPISSSAHLVLVPWLLGWDSPSLGFDIALHMGTLVAVVGYFAADWWRVALAARDWVVDRQPTPDSRLFLGLVVGTVPAGLMGLLARSRIEAFFHSDSPETRRLSVIAIAIALALLALALLAAERWAAHHRTLDQVGIRDVILIGCAQAMALFPGVSRSGATITAGLALGLTRPVAARVSFLLSVPIMVAAGLVNLLESGAVESDQLGVFVVGFLVALVSGLVAIHGLLKFLARFGTHVFAWYRIGLAIVLITSALGRA